MLERLRTFPRDGTLKIIALISTISTLLLFLEMRRIDAVLLQGGYGIVDLELAFSTSRAFEILDKWSPALLMAARKSIMLDFIFIPSYLVFFSSIALLFSRRIDAALQSFGVIAAVLPFAATLLDIIENLSLLRLLDFAQSGLGPMFVLTSLHDLDCYACLVAGMCAALKFFLLGIVSIYIVVSGFSVLLKRIRAK